MADQGVRGQRQLNTGNTPFNTLMFLIQQVLGRVNVATLVQVQAVHTAGRTAAAGTVDVIPLVDQVDGSGEAQPQGIVYGIPFFRLQGGAWAVIVDPKVGDVGFCVFADRDLSKVKAGGVAAPPGSERRFDMADGLYLGGWNNAAPAPTGYIVIDETSISLVHPDGIDATTPTFTLNGDLQVNGDINGTGKGTFTGEVQGNGIHLSLHHHPGVQTGGGNTGGPVG